MQSSAENAARQALQRQVGLRPSAHWWTDCWTALSLQSSVVGADDVLQQALYHDLRDVVRTFGEDEVPSSSDQSTKDSHSQQSAQLPSLQLRHAIQNSLQATHNFQAVLPADFCLMVQVEEVLDVSANAMTRLQHVHNSNPPTATAHKRCLKIAYTDGYNADGEAWYKENENNYNTTQSALSNSLFIAMEVLPLPDLSVASRAGVKLVVRGPVTVRRGVALWHAGNVTVVGGQVAALVQLQTAALQQAQRVAGVGVDPTVRALIGTDAGHEDETETDEGEHASGDVVPVPPPAATTAPRQSLLYAPASSPPRQVTTTNSLPPPPQPAVPARHRSIATTTTATSYHHSNPSRDTASDFTAAAALSSSTPPQPVTAPRPAPQPPTITSNGRATLNPYKTPKPAPASTSSYTANSSSVSRSKISTGSSNHRPPVNPYARSLPPSAGQDPTGDKNDVIMLLDTEDEASPASKTNDAPVPSTTTVSQSTTMATAITTLSPSLPQTAPYDELYATLQSLVATGPDAFTQPREWVVELQQGISTRVDFNIISHKIAQGDGKKKKKEYEYWLLYKFGAAHTTAPLITCRLDTAMVQTCFQQSAADLRQLRKSDNAAAQRISKEGGQAVASRIAQPRLYRVTLHAPPDAFWQLATPRPLDSQHPLLLLREM